MSDLTELKQQISEEMHASDREADACRWWQVLKHRRWLARWNAFRQAREMVKSYERALLFAKLDEQENNPLNLDVSSEEARALHRVVRAMHDGHCPKCGHLGPSSVFYRDREHCCPVCKFTVTDEEAATALKLFQPYLSKSVEVFERWRPTAGTEQPNDTEQSVVKDILERQSVGIEKYGTTVAKNPLQLREWLQHAYEESLDFPIYLKRAMQEMDKEFLCEIDTGLPGCPDCGAVDCDKASDLNMDCSSGFEPGMRKVCDRCGRMNCPSIYSDESQ